MCDHRTKGVAHWLINDVDQDVVSMPSLIWLIEVDVQHDLQQSSNKEMECAGIVLLDMAQYDLHKLVWHLHQSSLIAHLPQHHHSHVHNVLCRQGPQCMCG